MKCDTKLATLVRDFFYERLGRERHSGRNTITTYRDAFKLYLAYLASINRGKAEFGLVTAENTTAFLADYESKGRSTRSRNLRLAVVKAFARYVMFKFPEDADAMNRILLISQQKAVRRVVGHLERDEIAAILDAAARHPEGARYRPLLLFMYQTGARVSETAGLTIGQLSLDTTKTVLIHGKGAKDRVTPLEPELVKALREAIAGRENRPDEPVFLSRYGRGYSRRGIAYAIGSIAKLAAVKLPRLAQRKVHPHLIRHTTAMHLLQSGVDLNSLRLMMGHTSVETTNIYIESDPEMKRRAIQQAQLEIPEFRPQRWNPTEDIISYLENL